MGYSTSCSLCFSSLQYGWKEVLAQKAEKTSGFQGWKDHGIDLSKLLEKEASWGIIPLWDYREVLMVCRDYCQFLQLRRVLLIIAISSSGYTGTFQWRQCISFQLSSSEDILILEAMLIRLQKDLSLLVIISKLCLKEKRWKEKVKRNLRMQIISTGVPWHNWTFGMGCAGTYCDWVMHQELHRRQEFLHNAFTIFDGKLTI